MEKKYVKNEFIGRLNNITFKYNYCHDLHNSQNVNIA